MNCHYCLKELIKVYRETYQEIITEDWMCNACQVHYEYVLAPREEPLLTKLAFYNIKIDDKKFEVQFSFVGTGTIVKRVFAPPPAGLAPLSSKTIVFILSFVPDNWNPSNIQHKLQLLLPFA